MATEILEKFRSAPPRGGKWTYRHPISGHEFVSPQIPALVYSVNRHEEANGYPVTDQKTIEAQLCINHPFSCGDSEQPSLLEKASNFTHAMVDWAKAGFPVASADILQQRLDICQACRYWRGARGGTLLSGACRKCGCQGVKLALATEACPIGRWGAST